MKCGCKIKVVQGERNRDHANGLYQVIEFCPLHAAAKEMLICLGQLSVRFQLEFKTTFKKCTCLQFEDNRCCRHIDALKAIRRAEGK